MKFLSLSLRPFGAFADRAWDFAPEGCDEAGGLHLIFGPNGGGKSTTLRAMRSALFGMERGLDGHTFPSKELRVGAHLKADSGEEIEFTRRAARKAWLWNSADDEALPEERLLPFLGGLDRANFETLYGLDLETMQAGGHDLLEGEGDIGRALFGAALGGTRLAAMLKGLKLESTALFGSPTKSRINLRIARRKEIERERNQKTRKLSVYNKSRKDWRGARKDADRLRLQRDELLREAREVEEKRGLVIPLEQLMRVRALLLSFGDQEPLAGDVLERFGTLQREFREVTADVERLKQSIRARTKQIADLGRLAHPDLLKAGDDLRELHGQVVSYEEALERLPALEERCEAARTQSGLARVDSKLMRNPVESLQVLKTLAAERRGCDAAASAAFKEHTRASIERKRVTDTLEQLPAVFAMERRSDLEQLNLLGTNFDQIDQRVPASTAVIAARLQLESARQTLDVDRTREREELASRERAARADQVHLEQSPLGAPPSEADLSAARENRDGVWSELRSKLTAGDFEASDAESLTQAMESADEVADRLRKESDRALERARIECELADIELSLADWMNALKSLTAQRAGEDLEWRDAWRLSGVVPQSAAIMHGLVEARALLISKFSAARSQALDAVATAKQQVVERATTLQHEESARDAVEERWRAWAKRLGFDPEVSAESATSSLHAVATAGAAAEELARIQPELEKLHARIYGFEEEARALSETTGVAIAESEGTDAERALAREQELHDAHQAATGSEAKLGQCQSDLAADEEQLQLAVAQEQELARALLEQRESCATPDAAAFEERVHSSARLAGLLEQKRQHLASIQELAPGRSLEELSASLDGARVESLDADLESCRAREAMVRKELDEAQEELGHHRRVVEGEGSDVAAQLASQDASLLAEITDDTERYVRLELARHLLEREIEKHREEHQGPLLARAGELFEMLTLGTYTKLIPSESHGKLVMEAKRRVGSPVGVAGMSTGTQDQLYLALRIASVEQMIRDREPMPFIADDLFVNFDDERTEAALKVLFELARSTQVIVFSHHRSVLESARRLSKDGVPIHVHELVSERERDDTTAKDALVQS